MHGLLTVDRLDDRAAGRKMPIERADSDAGLPGDLLEADVGADLAERRLRRIDQPFAVAPAVGARFSHRPGRVRFRLPGRWFSRSTRPDAQARPPLAKRRLPPYMKRSL